MIHHGDSFAGDTGTVMPPIFPTSTFAHGNAGGFDYTRSGNPNFRILNEASSTEIPTKTALPRPLTTRWATVSPYKETNKNLTRSISDLT